MTMKKLIITADDYGMSPAVNQAIDEGIAAGLITSTNVMMNMPFCGDAVLLKKKKISVGLHWVLTCGVPVLPREQIPSLVTQDGCFYSGPEFRARYRRGLIHNEDIQLELTAQYERFAALFGVPDYWNTHQDIHVDFRIHVLFDNTAAGLGMMKMRSHQRVYVPGSCAGSGRSVVWRIAEPVKSCLLDAWQREARRKGIASPEGLVTPLSKEDRMHPEYLFRHIQWGKKQIAEYVIHPATACDSPYFGQIAEKRIREYQLFTADATKNVLKDCGIELVSYGVL